MFENTQNIKQVNICAWIHKPLPCQYDISQLEERPENEGDTKKELQERKKGGKPCIHVDQRYTQYCKIQQISVQLH